MTKRRYLLALACYLAIPALMFVGGGLFRVIDPEMARRHADYVRDYRLLELLRTGVLMATGGLAVALWFAVCYLVVTARQRSLLWLPLAVAGPLGFTIIAMLRDRMPTPDDRYQQFLGKLKIYRRIPLEISLFVALWSLAYAAVALKRELMISYESFVTGTPTATIIVQQNASSGMWAVGEGLEVLYLVGLIYLLWPMFFNFLANRILGAARSVT